MRLALIGIAALGSVASAGVEFNRDIRPILSDRCYTCHGPDQAQAQEQAAPRHGSGAKADLGGHFAIVPGDPAKSELIRRITRRQLRPAHAARLGRRGPLSAIARSSCSALDRARRRSGRSTGRSFRRAGRRCPRSSDAHWPRNPIDHFVLARLEREGLTALARGRPRDADPPRHARSDRPAADARGSRRLPRRSLARTPMRRWSTGCWPRRATASGWRSRWLDAARYADTNGYQTDGERAMWRWRDWVIDAFNRNMPFDQFTVEQIAGDLLPERHARPEDRHRLQPQSSRQRRGRHHPRRVRGGVRGRSRRDHGHRLAGPDAGLRPLPRPQVRSDHAEGVLPALRLLQQRAGARQGVQVRQLAAGHHGADAGAAGAASARRELEPRAARGAGAEIASSARLGRAAGGRPRIDWALAR